MTIKERMEQAGARLAKAKVEVAEAQREWDALFRQLRERGAARGPAAPELISEQATSNGGSEKLPARVAAFLHAQPGSHQYRRIAAALDAKPATVRATLNILLGRHVVEKVGRGLWQAHRETTTPSSGAGGRP